MMKLSEHVSCEECQGEGMRPGLFGIVRRCPNCGGEGSLRVFTLAGWIVMALVAIALAGLLRPYL